MTVNLVARATNCVWSKDHPKHQLKRKPSSNLNQKQRRKPIYSLPAIGGLAKKTSGWYADGYSEITDPR